MLVKLDRQVHSVNSASIENRYRHHNHGLVVAMCVNKRAILKRHRHMEHNSGILKSPVVGESPLQLRPLSVSSTV